MARKPPAKPRAATPPRPVDDSRLDDTPQEDVQKRIEIAAYYRAEQRGFAPGHELEDWIAAEAEVRRKIGASAP